MKKNDRVQVIGAAMCQAHRGQTGTVVSDERESDHLGAPMVLVHLEPRKNGLFGGRYWIEENELTAHTEAAGAARDGGE